MIHSTMQDFALTVPAILRHGTIVHGHREVRTLQPNGSTRSATYADVAARAAQLAHALRGAGVEGDDRVATFLWNNQEHVEAYVAVHAMGAVLHALNLLLSAEQVGYIANHAEDRVVIVDGSLVPLFAPTLPQLSSVHTVIVTGDGDVGALGKSGVTVRRYEEFISEQPTMFEWPDIDERSAGALCYTSGTTGSPKGVAYSHRSTYLHSFSALTKDGFQFGADDTVLAIVPQFHANAWGSIYAAFMAGSASLLPDRFLEAEPLVKLIEAERPTIALAVPAIWSDVAAFFEKYDVPIFQAWGMTETSPLAASARPAEELTGEDWWAVRVTQGRPVAGAFASMQIRCKVVGTT